MSPPTKILVVDDEPDLAALVRQKFRRHIRDGIYTFEMAGDGVEALSQLEKNPDIEIVLTDINMPRMDGLTLLSRIAKLELDASVVAKLDPEFEEITEGEEEAKKEKLKTKWAALEAVVGAKSRLELIAKDLVAH